MTITPDQANRLKRDATDGPWMLDQQDPDEAPMIMSMRVENGLVTGTYIAESVEEDGDARLIAAAPDLAQTIAGMTWQHAVEVYNADAKCWIRGSEWISNREVAEQDIDAYSRAYGGAHTRLVRRLVGPVGVIDGD